MSGFFKIIGLSAFLMQRSAIIKFREGFKAKTLYLDEGASKAARYNHERSV